MIKTRLYMGVLCLAGWSFVTGANVVMENWLLAGLNFMLVIMFSFNVWFDIKSFIEERSQKQSLLKKDEFDAKENV
jgi:hypothetical protein